MNCKKFRHLKEPWTLYNLVGGRMITMIFLSMAILAPWDAKHISFYSLLIALNYSFNQILHLRYCKHFHNLSIRYAKLKLLVECFQVRQYHNKVFKFLFLRMIMEVLFQEQIMQHLLRCTSLTQYFNKESHPIIVFEVLI